jgi:hypothetical protein
MNTHGNLRLSALFSAAIVPEQETTFDIRNDEDQLLLCGNFE